MSRGSFQVTIPHPGEPMKAIHGVSPAMSEPRPRYVETQASTSRTESSGGVNGHHSATSERSRQNGTHTSMRTGQAAESTQFLLREGSPASPAKHSSSSPCMLHLQSVQKVAGGAANALCASPRGPAHIMHFTLDWKKMCQYRERNRSWCKVKSAMFSYGGQMWCLRGHVNNTVKDPSFLIIYPSCLLDCKEKKKRKKSPDLDQSPAKSSPQMTSVSGTSRKRRFSSVDGGESRYRCCMAYKLSLLCTNDVSSGRSTSGQTLTVNTDDEGVIFDSGKPLNPLQLVVPVGLLSPGPDAPSQYVMDELLHIRLVCWPVRTAFTCSIRVMDLFPWDGSSQLKRFGHICWESELFLFCGAWWRIVVFPKGHGQGSAQRMTVFLELVDMASTRKMPAPEMPLVVQGSFNMDQHRSASAMMVSASRNNVIKSSHSIDHSFQIGDLCGCRDSLLLQAEVDCVVVTFEVKSGQLQGAWCQPEQAATSFNGSPEMWAWYMQNHQSRWLRPGSRSLSARSSLNNLSTSLDPHQLNHRFSQVYPSPASPGVNSITRSFMESPGIPESDMYANGCVSGESVESMDNIGRPPKEHRSVSDMTKDFQQSCSLPSLDDGEASV